MCEIQPNHLLFLNFFLLLFLVILLRTVNVSVHGNFGLPMHNTSRLHLIHGVFTFALDFFFVMTALILYHHRFLIRCHSGCVTQTLIIRNLQSISQKYAVVKADAKHLTVQDPNAPWTQVWPLSTPVQNARRSRLVQSDKTYT